MFSQSHAAVLNILGALDSRVTESVQRMDVGLRNFAISHEVIVYPDADHAFFNDARKEVYRSDAAKDAWNRTLSWFRKYIV